MNIGQGHPPGKLLLFEGDSPDEVVQCFADFYQLSQHKRDKLQDIVRLQLTKILQLIGEEEGSSDSSSDENEKIVYPL